MVVQHGLRGFLINRLRPSSWVEAWGLRLRPGRVFVLRLGIFRRGVSLLIVLG